MTPAADSHPRPRQPKRDENRKAPSESQPPPSLSPLASTVVAWRTWRQARHAALTGEGTDPLVILLRQWWKAERLPSPEKLTDEQARQVLDRISALEWDGRPFGDAVAVPVPGVPTMNLLETDVRG